MPLRTQCTSVIASSVIEILSLMVDRSAHAEHAVKRFGKYLSRYLDKTIDYWSIPHFLFGAVTALAAAIFLVPSRTAFFLTLVLAVLWELFEWKGLNVEEDFRNRVSDVIFPLVAYGATNLYVGAVITGSERKISLFAVVTFLFLYTNFMAWRARSRHDRDFMN